MVKKLSLILIFLSLVFVLAACAAPPQEPTKLVLATTTSTEDSGLLDYILLDFEQQYNTSVDVIAVGTGQALAMGASGDADILLVHARSREDEFVANGDGTQRYDVMYNDFVIVGPWGTLSFSCRR